MKRIVSYVMLVTLLVGCAGLNRGCSSFNAENFGSDWIIVQYAATGEPINCWQERNAAVTNETGTDGIYWLDSRTGHLIHISGWYNRVQVTGGRYEDAAKLMGVELERCVNGKYGVAKQ